MLVDALIYLLAAVISVPIATRLGFGSVLGYLIAGVLIGPFVLNLVGDQRDVMHVAEFGVVMMLFLIGLELQPSRLWAMRRPILGLGGLQVIVTAALISWLLAAFSSLSTAVAIAVGMAVALSSTAIVLQSLTERGLLKTQTGNNVFSVLLFQDIAVIPILALLPLLSTGEPAHVADHGGHAGWIAGLPGWAQFLISAATIAAIIAGGRFLSTPVFRYIAETRSSELFTAFALFIVVAIAVLMQAIGLSPALGTFLAGVVLAENEFRHEIEVDIEPFKGLLLGLFFITVGASIDFSIVLASPLVIFGGVLAIFVVKGLVLGALAIGYRMSSRQGWLFAVALAQGGEFAFVIATAGRQFGVFNGEQANVLTVIVALSMLLSPLLLVMYERIQSQPEMDKPEPDSQEIEATDEVILAGYGRFGQIVGRLLTAQGHKLSILDHSPSQIDLVRRFGGKVHYGDAAREDLLKAAGADTAKLLVVAVDDANKCQEIVATAQKHFPHLKILARAIDRRHAYALMNMKVDGLRRETFDSALQLGVNALTMLGEDPGAAKRAGETFAGHDEQSLKILFELWGDDASYGVAIRQRMEDLQQVLTADAERRKEHASDREAQTNS